LEEENWRRLDIVAKFSAIAALVWIALTLSFCAIRPGVTIQPTPIKIYSMDRAAAPVVGASVPAGLPVKPCPPVNSTLPWLKLAQGIGNVIAPWVPTGLFLLAFAIATYFTRDYLTELMRGLFGDPGVKNRPARIAVTLLTVCTTAFTAFQAELGEHNPIILVVGGIILLTPLVLRCFTKLWQRCVALGGITALLVTAPVVGIWSWPFFTKPTDVNRNLTVHITGYQAVLDELEKVHVWTIAGLSVLFFLYIINAGLALIDLGNTGKGKTSAI
jgi:hypothetical protein